MMLSCWLRKKGSGGPMPPPTLPGVAFFYISVPPVLSLM